MEPPKEDRDQPEGTPLAPSNTLTTTDVETAAAWLRALAGRDLAWLVALTEAESERAEMKTTEVARGTTN